jgi:autotransporter-associated beta strand protein
MLAFFPFSKVSRPPLRCLGLVAVIASSLGTTSHAIDYTWNASGNSNTWETTTNWLPNGTPGSGDTLLTPAQYGRLNMFSSKALTAINVDLANTWFIGPGSGAGAVTLTVGSVTKTGSGSLTFSRSGVGPLSLSFGSLTLNGGGLDIGGGTGSTGTVLVSGLTTVNAGTLRNFGGNSGSINYAGGLEFSTSTNTSFHINRTADSGEVSAAFLSGGFNAAGSNIQGSTDVGLVSTLVLTGNSDEFSTKTYSGQIINGGSGRSTIIEKRGSMTQIFQGASSYTGGTIISAGTLLVNNATGSGIGTGTVVVENGGTFGGGNAAGTTGFVSGLVDLDSGGHLAPGVNAVGRLTLQSGLTLNDSGGSILDMELGTSSDLIRITAGTFTGNSSGFTLVNVSDAGGFGIGTYTLIDWTGATLSGVTALDFQLNSTPSGYTGTFDIVGSTLQLTVSAIPEPSSAILFGLGFAVFLFRNRRA